jgi:hypothetical protein
MTYTSYTITKVPSDWSQFRITAKQLRLSQREWVSNLLMHCFNHTDFEPTARMLLGLRLGE